MSLRTDPQTGAAIPIDISEFLGDCHVALCAPRNDMGFELLLFDDFDAAQVLAQCLGNNDGAIGSLVLLHDCGEDTGSSQTGTVHNGLRIMRKDILGVLWNIFLRTVMSG